ncbi:MAG: hypothetical protein EGQ40_02045 [Clostridiales bacterium]|nr:hypothetical protein [Clostridiales bacterium]
MRERRATKRALLTSIMALVMCVVMLVGTTFAWFTDTATANVNTIKAGDLKLGLEMATAWDADGNPTDWDDARGKTLSFLRMKDGGTVEQNADILWEPGATYRLPELRVSNAGNLNLKYKVQITGIETNRTPTSTANLNDVIDWTITYGGTPLTTGSDEYMLNANEATTQYDIIAISGTMKTSANNDYQGLSIDGVAVTVYATQMTGEYDSSKNNYDKDAQYPVVNSAALANAITNAAAGSSVTVAPGAYDLPAAIPAGVSISGAGMGETKLTAPATPSGNQKTGLVVKESGVTISNATITGSSDITPNEYCGVVDVREGGTTLESVEIVNRASWASGVVINRGVDAGETVTMKNSKLNVYYRAFYVVDNANGTIEIDNCDITGSIYALNVNSASSQELVIKCTNSKLHGWSSYGEIKSASFENVEFSKGASQYDYLRPYANTTLKNCTFDDGFKMGAGTTGFTITIEDCTYNGTLLTAANVENLMLDSDNLNELKGCTITVNGTTVTL